MVVLVVGRRLLLPYSGYFVVHNHSESLRQRKILKLNSEVWARKGINSSCVR